MGPIRQNEKIAARLRQAGYRLTTPRRAVLAALPAGRTKHISAAEVLARARRPCPSLGRATVYRTLDLLTSVGILRPIVLGGEQHYMRAEGAHHHLVCSGCGAVIEFTECASRMVARKLSKKLGFDIRGHLLEFFGLCRACRAWEGER